MLNDRGVPNPTEYKRQQGLRYKQPKDKNSTLWKYFAISDMLSNEIYIGNMVQGKYGSISYKSKKCKPRPKSEWFVVEGTHEPIIDRELWGKVQRLVAQRAKPFTVGTIGLFARKARCLNCGYVMRSSKNRGRHYLQCASRHIAKDSCDGAFISVEKLEQIVVTELNRLTADFLDKERLEKSIIPCQNLHEQKARLSSDLITYRKKADEFARGLRELYMDKVKGVITEGDYIEMSKDFTQNRERFIRLIADNEKKILALDEQMSLGESRQDIIRRYTNIEHLTREMVEILIDHITIGKRIKGTQYVPVEIYWNF